MSHTNELIWIVGFGRFGRRAVDRLITEMQPPPSLTVIDRELPDDLQDGIEYIQADGVEWFTDHFLRTEKVSRIVPALPVHLAAQWVKRRLTAESRNVEKIPIPSELLRSLPNPYQLSPDVYAFSHADFICPPDCVEPEEFCTVTREPRPTPLYDLPGSLSLGNYVVVTIRSRQFAPGVGGFYPADLWALLDKVRKHEETSFLLCTACKCHGIITGFRI